MAYITLSDAQAWAEETKLTLGNLQEGLANQVATQVLGRIAQAYDITGWTNDTNTPSLLRSIIAMQYVGWYYSKTYSEDETGNNWYANRLLAMSDELIDGIIAGTTELGEIPEQRSSLTTSPIFYPTDTSSAQVPTVDDPSLGPARFTMGSIF